MSGTIALLALIVLRDQCRRGARRERGRDELMPVTDILERNEQIARLYRARVDGDACDGT